MHISEGILSAPVLAGGAALAVAGTAVGLRRLNYDHVARAGMLAAAFFVASLVHVPIGPANMHLILNGLVGLLLGWAAFPVILVALVLQAVMFQFGGFTTLGVNTLIMALPAVVCYHLFGRLLFKAPWVATSAAFACGALSVLIGALIAGAALALSERQFLTVATLLVGAHLPVMVIEGLITAFCVRFLHKVQPELLRPGKDAPC